MKLEEIIMTEQQEQGLSKFRKFQKECSNYRDDDFLGWYVLWQAENGYFDDSNDFYL